MNSEPKVPKKRGRKPKGGKIINVSEEPTNTVVATPNIILHLKCNSQDIKPHSSEQFLDNNNILNFEKLDNYKYTNNQTINSENIKSNIEADIKTTIHEKLKVLAKNLHTNDISDKKSACFWCTCDFDNPPIYIPKYVINGSYHVYGCFCSPECATGYLFEQSGIDLSAKYERYALLNHIYCKIYNYDKNIKPAPDPYHILDKFYGNLTIQEYRQLLKNERLLLIVDKPLTRSLPELHEDNDNFIFNNYSGDSFKLKRNYEKKTKSEIFENNFNMR